jgi:hypothetical protein
MIVKEQIEKDEADRKANAELAGREHTAIDVDARHLQLKAIARDALRSEIQHDPAKRGYAGRSQEEIAGLINSEPSRVGVFWNGIPYTKNAIDANDVKEAIG